MSREAARIRGRAAQDPLSSKLALDFLFGALAATTLIYILRLTPLTQDTALDAALGKATLEQEATEAAAKVAEDKQAPYAMREHLVGFPMLEGDVAVVMDYSASIFGSEGFGVLYQTIIEEVAFNSPDVKRVKLHAFNASPNMFDDPGALAVGVPQYPSWVELGQAAAKPDEAVKPWLQRRGWPEAWASTERGALFGFIRTNLPGPAMPGRKQLAIKDNVGYALRAAVNAFSAAPVGKQNILLVGDGDAYRDLKSPEAAPERAALEEAIAKAISKGIQIHAVAAMADRDQSQYPYAAKGPVTVGTPRALSDFYIEATSRTGGTLLLLPFQEVEKIAVAPSPSPSPPPPSSPPLPPPASTDVLYQFETGPSTRPPL